ncbi:MAG: glycosyltransferase family 2 protein [Blastocatellia bacterium]|nr:glycosyltransferase family 2 protein [Blastocatellia bacterium]
MTVAIVTTLRNPPALDSWIRYHLAVGFDHLFLFFDDPDEPLIQHPQVTAISHDKELRRKWLKSLAYAKFEYFHHYIDREAMARQILNCDVAIRLALERRIQWLLHIDADELFYSPDESVQDHFQALTEANVRQVIYPNHEALPERAEIENPFLETTLFKLNRHWQTGGVYSREQIALIKSVPQLAERFFLFYTSGKAAAMVTEGLLPNGVHRFEGGSMVATQQVILHYPICGFEQFWSKYTALGRFADQWFGQVDIQSVEPFHLEARDIVAAGDRDRAREFYMERVVLDDQQVINRLINAGALARICLNHLQR